MLIAFSISPPVSAADETGGVTEAVAAATNAMTTNIEGE